MEIIQFYINHLRKSKGEFYKLNQVIVLSLNLNLQWEAYTVIKLRCISQIPMFWKKKIWSVLIYGKRICGVMQIIIRTLTSSSFLQFAIFLNLSYFLWSNLYQIIYQINRINSQKLETTPNGNQTLTIFLVMLYYVIASAIKIFYSFSF